MYSAGRKGHGSCRWRAEPSALLSESNSVRPYETAEAKSRTNAAASNLNFSCNASDSCCQDQGTGRGLYEACSRLRPQAYQGKNSESRAQIVRCRRGESAAKRDSSPSDNDAECSRRCRRRVSRASVAWSISERSYPSSDDATCKRWATGYRNCKRPRSRCIAVGDSTECNATRRKRYGNPI